MSEINAPEVEVAAKPAKAKKEPKVVVPRDQQNGVTRPAAGTKTGRVWEIADGISAQLNTAAPRKDVVAAGKAEGINEATITTQYGHWRRYNGLTTVREVVTAAAPVTDASVELGSAEVEGQPVVVPASEAGKGKKKKA